MTHILVADDDSIFGSNLSEILKRKGFKIQIAQTMLEALEKASQKRFDVILLDQLMPGAAKAMTLTQLREMDQSIKIISMTASPKVINGCIENRIKPDAVIAKPFVIGHLLKEIEGVLAWSQTDKARVA
ncbi:MAG: response regulator [Magnetococcales bacterium]|nr:response regulator [Magnetococcales bacterium]